MNRANPKFGPGYVHAVSPEQAVADGIAGRPFHMLAWAHDFCRRHKRDVLTTREMHMSGVAIDNRTIQKYLRGLQEAGHIQKVSRGHWQILSLSQVGYKQANAAMDAAKNVASTQLLKVDQKASSGQVEAIFPQPNSVALLNQESLSKNLKANAPQLPSAALTPLEAPRAHPPIAAVERPPACRPPVAAKAKDQVARQAGLVERQDGSIADMIFSIGMLASGGSMQGFESMPSVDLDTLDTEAILKQDRQDAALLAAHRAPSRAPTKKAASAPLPAETQLLVGPKAPELMSTPQSPQRLEKSVIRYNLSLLAEAVPEFTFGEKEINALRKWPVTEAQLVDLKNVAVARKRKGKLTVGVGAYLYGAVRRASLGGVPTRQG